MELLYVLVLSIAGAAGVVLLGAVRAGRGRRVPSRTGWERRGELRAVLARLRGDERGVIPVVAVLAVAGIGIVIDQLVFDGDVSAKLFDLFFKAVQALADAVFAAVGAMIGMLPDAADLGLVLPSGIVRGYTLLNSFLPLAEALTAVGVIMAAYGVLFTWRLAVTIYKLIPKPLMGT